MSAAVTRLKARRDARSLLNDALRDPSNVCALHYACESFDAPAPGMTPRITSIVVRHSGTKENHSFSWHLVAEEMAANPGALHGVAEADVLEKRILAAFYALVAENKHCTWVAWNMRDVKFGFQALAHRFRVLGGDPLPTSHIRTLDLGALAPQLYGPDYVAGARLEGLIDLNGITKFDFLSGGEEAAAIGRGEHQRVHASTLRKVDCMTIILERIAGGTLKTNATWRSQYGLPVVGLIEVLSDSWQYKLVGAAAVLATILCLVL